MFSTSDSDGKACGTSSSCEVEPAAPQRRQSRRCSVWAMTDDSVRGRRRDVAQLVYIDDASALVGRSNENETRASLDCRTRLSRIHGNQLLWRVVMKETHARWSFCLQRTLDHATEGPLRPLRANIHVVMLFTLFVFHVQMHGVPCFLFAEP